MIFIEQLERLFSQVEHYYHFDKGSHKQLVNITISNMSPELLPRVYLGGIAQLKKMTDYCVDLTSLKPSVHMRFTGEDRTDNSSFMEQIRYPINPSQVFKRVLRLPPPFELHFISKFKFEHSVSVSYVLIGEDLQITVSVKGFNFTSQGSGLSILNQDLPAIPRA